MYREEGEKEAGRGREGGRERERESVESHLSTEVNNPVFTI